MGKRATEILYGFHPVKEALRAGRREIVRIYTLRPQGSKRLAELLAYAEHAQVPAQAVSPNKMKAIAQTEEHQGVCIEASAYPLVRLQTLIDGLEPDRAGGCLLLLDSIVDPHNLGALIRTACCAAVKGVVITKNRAAPPSPAVSKTSAGALEHVRIARVTNMVSTMKHLQAHGWWLFGLAAQADRTIYESDLTGPTALVIGGESKGLRPLVKKTCDQLVSIPQTDTIDSLNASVAGALAIYEIYRQQLATT